MALNPEIARSVEESRRRLAAMGPAENRGAAELLRETGPVLGTERKRELAEELATGFEERARAQARSISAP